ncbi:MAG: putative glycosyltransferase [Candidatus Scalindua rubra]|uniref:Putative glycosyltransferase n=1 Tax=Candidatus Scalindua rubra TaxID=1872076 RepID=A0A1E3XB07_9BACT|nr:MAG: putative glycosyltransferase [Candidatus Scalindua rubra]
MKCSFWILIFLIIYVYLIYPVLLFVLDKIKSMLVKNCFTINHYRQSQNKYFTPSVSLIISAYNEERAIRKKIENCLLLDYPGDKLEIIVGSDGSTDCTDKIVKSFKNVSKIGPNVKLVQNIVNKGKSSIQNKAVDEANGDIIIFSDATGIYNKDAIKNLVRNFADKGVGCVAGVVRYVDCNSSISKGEGTYWKYEMFLRQLEDKIGNLAMASGSIMAFRKKLFKPLDEAVGEDFVIPLQTVLSGHKVIYDSVDLLQDGKDVKLHDLLFEKLKFVNSLGDTLT